MVVTGACFVSACSTTEATDDATEATTPPTTAVATSVAPATTTDAPTTTPEPTSPPSTDTAPPSHFVSGSPGLIAAVAADGATFVYLDWASRTTLLVDRESAEAELLVGVHPPQRISSDGRLVSGRDDSGDNFVLLDTVTGSTVTGLSLLVSSQISAVNDDTAVFVTNLGFSTPSAWQLGDVEIEVRPLYSASDFDDAGFRDVGDVSGVSSEGAVTLSRPPLQAPGGDQTGVDAPMLELRVDGATVWTLERGRAQSPQGAVSADGEHVAVWTLDGLVHLEAPFAEERVLDTSCAGDTRGAESTALDIDAGAVFVGVVPRTGLPDRLDVLRVDLGTGACTHLITGSLPDGNSGLAFVDVTPTGDRLLLGLGGRGSGLPLTYDLLLDDLSDAGTSVELQLFTDWE